MWKLWTKVAGQHTFALWSETSLFFRYLLYFGKKGVYDYLTMVCVKCDFRARFPLPESMRCEETAEVIFLLWSKQHGGNPPELARRHRRGFHQLTCRRSRLTVCSKPARLTAVRCYWQAKFCKGIETADNVGISGNCRTVGHERDWILSGFLGPSRLKEVIWNFHLSQFSRLKYFVGCVHVSIKTPKGVDIKVARKCKHFTGELLFF